MIHNKTSWMILVALIAREDNPGLDRNMVRIFLRYICI